MRKMLIDKLNEMLKNEYTHMHYYLQSSFLIEGLHKMEIGEWLAEQAASEFKHIQQFAKVIVGLGGVPETEHFVIPYLTDPQEILQYAHGLEFDVVGKYVQHMEVWKDKNTTSFDDVIDIKYIEVFLEEQLLDSRADLDEIKQMLKGKV